ncbi:hypothetical protein NDU88_003006 [Pleurodeles waltl]|uniref:Uncharacterized protein n=1 Tax=Pleurodeles waltl TaxID=8319 RepID=A0AAV7Q8B7_PLEWA|nr:hypothetical protein NDU88_003006 [Pleurodeles waltl]
MWQGAATPPSRHLQVGVQGAAPSARSLLSAPEPCCLSNPRGSVHRARPQLPSRSSPHLRPREAALGGSAVPMSARPREPSPGRHFVLPSDRVAARERDPSPSVTHHDGPPRDPGVTRTSKAASFAPLDRVNYGRMTEGSRKLSECDRHLDA